MLAAAARMHKKRFEQFVAEAGDPNVVVRQSAAPTAALTAAEKVLGKQPTAPATYGASQTVTAVVSDASVAVEDRYTAIPSQIAALGRAEKLDLLLRLTLASVLVNPEHKYGTTIFDTAKDVQIGGAVFQVRGTARSGLPPEGPYILWVALRKAGE
jgi:hypothetical protein